MSRQSSLVKGIAAARSLSTMNIGVGDSNPRLGASKNQKDLLLGGRAPNKLSETKKHQTQLTSVASHPYQSPSAMRLGSNHKDSLDMSQIDGNSSHHASTLQSNLGRRTNESLF